MFAIIITVIYSALSVLSACIMGSKTTFIGGAENPNYKSKFVLIILSSTLTIITFWNRYIRFKKRGMMKFLATLYATTIACVANVIFLIPFKIVKDSEINSTVKKY